MQSEATGLMWAYVARFRHAEIFVNVYLLWIKIMPNVPSFWEVMFRKIQDIF